MTLKQSLCAAALTLPLVIAGAGPSAADHDMSFGLGFGSPYYAGYPYHHHGLYDPYYYDDDYYDRGLVVADDADVVVVDDDFDDDDDMVVEPAAAAPEACVKTNVRNLKNACPF
jgi:hypothetical protein